MDLVRARSSAGSHDRIPRRTSEKTQSRSLDFLIDKNTRCYLVTFRFTHFERYETSLEFPSAQTFPACLQLKRTPKCFRNAFRDLFDTANELVHEGSHFDRIRTAIRSKSARNFRTPCAQPALDFQSIERYRVTNFSSQRFLQRHRARWSNPLQIR